MFRKYYKEANDDIKASEEFINSVIQNAHKRRSPLMRGYAKYAVTAAAALVIVSAAVISEPVWKNMQNADDKVTVEESVTRTAPPTSTPVPDAQASNADVIPSPGTSIHSYTKNKADAPELSGENSASAVNPPKAAGTYNSDRNGIEDKGRKIEENGVNEATPAMPDISGAPESTAGAVPESAPPLASDAIEAAEADPARFAAFMEIYKRYHESEEDDNGHSGGGNSNPTSANVKKDNDAGTEMSAASAGQMYSSADDGEPPHLGGSGGDSREDTPKSVYIPTPAGYSCEYRTEASASFVNDNGATITVDAYYSGEADAPPSYGGSGENISVSMSTGGMTVEIYAEGADRSSVDEIVNGIE